MAEDALREFRDYMRDLPQGEVNNIAELERRLASCWDFLDGSDLERMAPHKLRNRVEDPWWDPPMLCFTIERHGGLAMGSTRAELQRWVVDVDAGTADCCPAGYRQLYKRDAPVKVGPIAEEVVGLILAGQQDPRLTWIELGRRVRVTLSACLPIASNQQTHQGRSRRLRRKLRELLEPQGWKEVGPFNRVIFERMT